MLQEQEKYTNHFLKTRQKILNSLVDSLYLTIQQSCHAESLYFSRVVWLPVRHHSKTN